MLKLRYLFENYDLAKFVLGNWDYDQHRLDEMLSYFRISSNAIYPFFVNGNICFLRLAPVSEKKENNIYGELEFIQYLRNNKFPVLKPIPSKKGEYIIKVNTEWGEYYAEVFERVDGVQLEETDCSEKIIYESGKTLGKMHKLSSMYEPKIKKWTHEDVLEWISSELPNHRVDAKIYMELESLKKEMSMLTKSKENYGLIHYDFELDNVFYDEKTNSCSVIDFDDGMYSWFASDIGQCFDSLEEELSEEKLDKAKIAFIEGYTTEYTFTDEMQRVFPIMRRFANLYGYTRILYSTSDTFEEEPDWLIELRKKLGNMLKEIESGLDVSN